MKTAATHVSMLLLVLLGTGCTHIRNLFDGQPGGVATGTTGGFFFQEENDSISLTNRDKYYTQGLRWAETINTRAHPQVKARVDGVANKFCSVFCKQFSYGAIWSSGIAQTMYTPDDIKIPVRQPYDRPWAGFIYLDNTLRLLDDNTNATTNEADPKTLLVLELQTGTIGERSGAHWSQGALHALIGSPRPEWVDQLNRPIAVEAIYQWNKRWGNRYIDVLPFAGGAVGNVMLYANAGAYVRLGWNLSGFFNTGPMQGTFAVGGARERPPTEGFFYMGGNATFIPYNYFLRQGDIHPQNRVRDRLVGGSFRYRSYRLTANFVRRSREFEHPLGPQFSQHEYGSVVLSYELIMQ